MTNRLKLASVIAALSYSLMLSGCSSTALNSPKDDNPSAFIKSAEAEQLLSKKSTCCDNVKQLKYQPLDNDKAQYVSFDITSSAFDFKGGKSFYKAYQLNKNISELTVTVSGLFYNTVFSPQVLLLDSQFKKTRVISAEKFEYKEAKFINGDELSARFTIKRPNLNNPANETYFVIYSNPKAMQGSTSITHPAKLDARARSVVEPNINDPIIPHSAMGVVKLTFKLVNKEDSYIAAEQAPTETSENTLTEAQYNEQIVKAVGENEVEKALTLVDQAEAVGSKTARPTFVEAIKK